MPNPIKYKSVGVAVEAYDKLVAIAEKEDRNIGRQLSRMIDQTYEDLFQGVNTTHGASSVRSAGLGGLTDLIET